MIKQALILLFLMPFLASAQTDSLAHLYAFGGGRNDVGEDVQSSSDGGYIVVGSTASSGDGNTDIYLLKVDSFCNYQWSYALGDIGNDWGYSVKETQDKGYIVASSTNSYGNSYQASLMKRDSLGNYDWQRNYGKEDWDFVYDITNTFDNGFVFCGETYNNTNGYSDVWVVKINNLGDTLWTRTVGGNLIDKGNAIIETLDSNIVVAGITTTISDSTQAYILKFDKDGVLIWDSIYGGQKYEWIYDVVESEPDKYTVTGSTNSNSNGDLDHYILNVNKNGVQQWDFTITNSAEDDEMCAIDLMPNGNILVIGYTETGGGGKKNVTMFTLTPSGFWGGNSTVISNKEDDNIKGLTINNLGRIVGVGVTNSFGNGNKDILLLRMDVILPSNDTTSFVENDIAPIGIKEVENKNNNYIYPTIIENDFVVNIKDYDEVEVVNIKGQVEMKFYGVQRRFYIPTLKPGLFIITIKSKGKIISQSKIIKK
jgi:hypothetical protein